VHPKNVLAKKPILLGQPIFTWQNSFLAKTLLFHLQILRKYSLLSLQRDEYLFSSNIANGVSKIRLSI
jgi:hypothetical protein